MVDVVVIGAGLAGAATAYALSRLGGLKVVVLEREKQAGRHASGHNAAMVRQAVARAALIPVLAEGARFIRTPPPELRGLSYRRCGSLILTAGDDARRLRSTMPALRAQEVQTAWMTPSDVPSFVPLTEGACLDGALYSVDDGVVDVAALLEGYLRQARAAGTGLEFEQEVRAIRCEGGAVRAVETSRGDEIETRVVVNAAGAWCGELGVLAGAAAIPLRPTRRHLMVTPSMRDVLGSWPIVWDDSHALYFRPESGGLLLSPCDETDCQPGEPPTDPTALEELAGKLSRWMPRLAGIAVQRTWAGIRTLTPDGNFVIGEDPVVRGFFWCAGLGGHGVAASAAVGRLAAGAILGRAVPAQLGPRRFAGVP
jgi:D-arginine dehydrogenase